MSNTNLFRGSKYFLLFICLFLLISQVDLVAQPDDNGGDPPGNDVPLDGGVSILVACGTAYAVRKIKRLND